jgi:DNA polymerase (family 10)
MPVHNKEIADIFNRLADLLEIQDANPFRVRAYRGAARTIGSLPRGVTEMLDSGDDLSDLPGIDDDLAGKIQEIVQTGHLQLLDDIKQETASELSEIMKLPGLGPKRVRALHDQLNIDSLKQLRQAAADGDIRKLDGFGEKTEQKILREIDRRQGEPQRTKLADVDEIAKSLTDFLSRIDGVKKVIVAGSYRRRKETVGDLDILVTCKKDSRAMDCFVGFDEVDEVISHGRTRSTVLLRSGLQVDLRVVPEVSYGAALYYFTGSKDHNIAVRKIAQRKNLKINEYGVFQADDRVAGKTEEGVLNKVGLAFIPPELRENRGEIEAAKRGELPELIEREDLRGNLHTHTDETDGRFSLEEMAEAAKELGLEYLAITDHSKAVAMARGLNEKRLKKQIRAIEKLNARMSGIRILTGIEVDIMEDGSLDLEPKLLEELDFVIGSIHRKFDLPKNQQTERIIRAMDHACFHCLGHPTGRLIQQREPYDIDIEKVMDAAIDRGCFLELNAQPDRLDLNDAHCKLAKEKGLKIAISADAHSKTDLQFLRFGIDQARRGWLEADDVINTRSWAQLQKLLRTD